MRQSSSSQGPLARFYWPAVITDIVKFIFTCEACQKFSHKSKAPVQPV
jgi:hypothetical protein